MKLFTYTYGGVLRDSTAGAARTNVQAYDTTISVPTDTSVWAVFHVWFAGQSSFGTWPFLHEKLATATVDSQTVARIVWNTPQSGHTIAGTFGKYLDLEVSSVAGGTGPYSVTIVSYDTVNSCLIPYTTVAIRNLTQTASYGTPNTGATATGTANLTADTFLFIAAAAGNTFKTYDTHVVTGAQTDTVKGAEFEPDSPPSPDYATVYGYIYDSWGTPIRGAKITAQRTAKANATDTTGTPVIISAQAVSTDTDTLGYFALQLLRTHNYTDTTHGFYWIKGEDGQLFEMKDFYVPATGNVNLGDSLAARTN